MIAIYAPYGRGETTLAAIRLADFTMSVGLPVRLVAVSRHEQNVHPFWDRKVISGRDCGIYNTSQGCTHAIWFLGGEALVKRSRLIAPRAKHILVPSIHATTTEQLLDIYDLVVCPTRTAHSILLNRLGIASDKRLTWCRWDSGLTHIRREGTVLGGMLRVLVRADAGCIDEYPTLFLHLLEQCLYELPGVYFTLTAGKAWPRRERRWLRRLLVNNTARLQLSPRLDLVSQVADLHEHDWMWLADGKANFGIHITRALACGTPVLCYDSHPFDEYVQTGHNGCLIPTELQCTGLGAPSACPSSTTTLNTIVRALTDTSMLFEAQSHEWQGVSAYKAFMDFWADVLML